MADQPVVIYHNARCSKSRAACQLIAERGVPATVINYLETPPSREELRALLAKLGMAAADLVRRSEPAYQDLYAGRTLPVWSGLVEVKLAAGEGMILE